MTVRDMVWHQIQSNDHRLMRRVHRWRAPRWFRCGDAGFPRRGGDGWLWYALGLVLFLFGGDERFPAIGAACSAAIAGIFLFRFLKHSRRRKRPCEIEPHCWASILPPDKYSFPSGPHAITAFSVAISVGLFYPQLLGALLAAAVLIAASRIILGMHFLSDVLAGGVLGTLLGFAAFRCFGLL